MTRIYISGCVIEGKVWFISALDNPGIRIDVIRSVKDCIFVFFKIYNIIDKISKAEIVK